ncbi:DEAD/DEAH box helicase family protein [Acinetobacter sp.]|uniref:DEAD/DEAH box helicase family protein n=1 Tax=Acinetobacter sp. TaxID=472 RepID=UPI003D018F12
MILKDYQTTAVNELERSIISMLDGKPIGVDYKTCILESPTGSGKTIMLAETIRKLVGGKDMCFIWISIGAGSLQEQSADKLKSIFNGTIPVTMIEELHAGGAGKINPGEVVVLNWEKVRSRDKKTGDWKNVVMRQGEKYSFPDIIDNTLKYSKIVLIIDESHQSASTSLAGDIKGIIKPSIIVEASATPIIHIDALDIKRGDAEYITVDPLDVIEEGMIKESCIINPGLDKTTLAGVDAVQAVLSAALLKRKQLVQLYSKEASVVKPLVLVQLPDGALGEDKKHEVISFLKEHDITVDNGKLAIWLSDEKENLTDVEDKSNPVEFLIFKQAVATGWDCPRAHILVKFRDIKSETFEIQTIGRIIRMPEHKHYREKGLNQAYVFTNVHHPNIKDGVLERKYIKTQSAERKTGYKKLNLTSFFLPSSRYGYIAIGFMDVYRDEIIKPADLKLGHIPENRKKLEARGINLDVDSYKREVILDKVLTGDMFDHLSGELEVEKEVALELARTDLQYAFELAIRENLQGFGPKNSIARVKEAIYLTWGEYVGITSAEKMQRIFLANYDKLRHSLNTAIAKYKLSMVAKLSAVGTVSSYEAPETIHFNEHSIATAELERYLYDPSLIGRRSKPELTFEELISESDNVTWWWKNGENKKDYFGIKYIEAGKAHTFYPDYLVQFASGKVGIFETKDPGDKDGNSTTKYKAEALHAYIAENNKAGYDLIGGIVINSTKGLLINQMETYDWPKWTSGDDSDWELLSNVIKEI